jgi:hypothetical protein
MIVRGIAAAVLVAAHVAVLPRLLHGVGGEDLSVQVTPSLIAPEGKLRLTAAVPPALADRVERRVDGEPTTDEMVHVGPGLHRLEWLVRYSGGFERRVGVTATAGPFHDPAQPRCGVRLWITQRFLDETLAPLARGLLETNLRGLGHWTIGDFQAIDTLKMTWRRRGNGPGALDLDVTLRFKRAKVPIWIAATLIVKDGELAVTTQVGAHAELTSGWLTAGADALSGLGIFDKDEEARAQVTREVETATGLLTGLKLPSLFIPSGTLDIGFCPGRPIEVVDQRYAILPLAILPRRQEPPGLIPPVALGETTAPPEPPASPLALDVELDVLNEVLHRMWAAGTLDDLISGQAREAFNLSPTTREWLTLRVADLRIAIPPMIEVTGSKVRPFSLGAELALQLTDGDSVIPARLHGRLGFGLRSASGKVSAVLSPDTLAGDLSTSAALTCEPRPGRLEPCFSTVLEVALAELRVHRQVAHAWLTTEVTKVLDQIVRAHRFELAAVQRQIVLEPRETTAHPEGRSARIRVDLDVTVAAP